MAIVGCGTRPPPRHESVATDTHRGQITSSARVAGRWALEMSPLPDEPTARIWLELDIDSVSAGRLFGRLASYLAGDVGIEPSVFPRFDGELTGEGEITIGIGHVDPAVSGFRLRGTVATDTIPLDLFVIGPDTVSGGTWRWRLVRRP